MELIGRERERKRLNAYLNSENSEFIMLYGRRRVGKTFLIREHFSGQFSFYLTGLANSTTKKQLANFHSVYCDLQSPIPKTKAPKNWFEAFQRLISALEKSRKKRKVIFIDELPWLDTAKSDFVSALEHFWNHWASGRNDILLIVCGSSNSWMINKLINNKGGLHNRISGRIKLEPFSLYETELFLKSQRIVWNRMQIAECYMIMGGIPYYLSLLNAGFSLAQNVDLLFFKKDALLKNEYENLYPALFKNVANYIAVIEALSTKTKGLERNELIKIAKITNGGATTKVLDELESNGFLRKYQPFGKLSRQSLYQLTDFYSGFYFRFVKNNKSTDENFWINNLDSPAHRAWSGFAFEQLCLHHIHQIKHALGISGVHTSEASWRSRDTKNPLQIDLLIDRKDQVVNLCEMKFSIHEFSIDKKYSDEIRNKIGKFKDETKTRKAVYFTMVTTYGCAHNEYFKELVRNELTIEHLFIKD